MSRISDQAAAIAATIDAVDDSGVVYAYRPMPKGSWDEFLKAWTVVIEGKRGVRAWTVQYQGEERHEANIARHSAIQTHYYRWKVRFYLGWDDPSSELTFRAVVEAVADALDVARTLGGACIDHDPVDITVPANGDGVVLGDYLCHLAEIDFRSWDQVSLTIV